jgi:hypothetical protein
LHKGFKCLNISRGRIYISRDVISDENVFPFSKLHENARARLRSEILLPPSLLSSNGVANTDLPVINSPPDNFETQNSIPSIAVQEMEMEEDQSREPCQSLAPTVDSSVLADNDHPREPHQLLVPAASSAPANSVPPNLHTVVSP